jgi:hypothetical protein
VSESAVELDVQLKCQCGQFRGVIEKFNVARGARIVCYCDDCQAYAHALEKAKSTLDRWGGTDITPVMPRQFKITHGKLSLMRLSKNGLFRWYADCCKSPVANSPNASLPYLGLTTAITDLSDDERDQRLGPIRFRWQTRYAIGTPPAPRSKTINFAGIRWVIKFVARGFLKVGAKPTPFYDSSGQPTARANVLTPEVRDHLRQFCGPKDY